MRITIILFIMLFYSFGFTQNSDTEEIEERIRPVGQVNVDHGTKNTKVEAPKEVNKLNLGQKIYDKYCIVCHETGVAGAPKFRNGTDWKSRQDKQNIDSLTTSAIKGLNAMPPKGTCLECSETDLKAAIQYMVPQA